MRGSGNWKRMVTHRQVPEPEEADRENITIMDIKMNSEYKKQQIWNSNFIWCVLY